MSHKDRHYSAMAQCFICLSAHLPFRNFRDDSISQIMSDVARGNDFQTLTIPRLKAHLNAKYNDFAKFAKK